MDLKSKRLFPIILFVIACSAVLIWQTGRYAHDWSMIQLKGEGEDRLLRVISQFRSALGEYQYLPFLISQNRDVKSLLLSPTPDKIADVSRYLEQTNLVAGSTALFILDQQGRAQAFSHWREQQDFYLVSHSKTPYFEQAQKGQQGVYAALPDILSDGAFYLSAPIYNHSRFAGAATVRIDLKLLQPELPQNEKFIISKHERVLLASDAHWALKPLNDVLSPLKQEFLGDGAVVDIRTLEDGRKVLVQSVLLDDLKWEVSVISSIEGVQAIERTVRLYSLGGCIAFSLLLLLLRERRLKNISRKETREVLERNEANQRNIINKTHVGLISLNSTGEIQFINPMAMKLFGVSMPRVLGLSIEQLIAVDAGHGPLRKNLGRIGSSGFAPITALETVGIRSDRTEFPMLFSINQMESKPEEVYLVTVIDITPRKRLERALQQANDQLEEKVLDRTKALKEAQGELVQAEKMAALGRMSSAVVHELNQPLTAMRTYISICRHLLTQRESTLDSSQSVNDPLDQNLELINSLTDRMAQLTRQLKIFAYKKPEQLTAVDLISVLDQSLKLFSARFENDKIQLDYARPEQKLSIAGDNARVEQIFVNLIKNACDAMAAVESEEHKLQITISIPQEPDAYITIGIADTGNGIKPEDFGHLFEPFFTTKSIGDGLGLGLSIVQSIVTDLQGEIRAYNTPAGGACFEVRLLKFMNDDLAVKTESNA